MIMRQMRAQLKRLAGEDAVYTAVTTGRSDYELAKNLKTISNALRSRKR